MIKDAKSLLEAEKSKLEEELKYYNSEDPFLVPGRDTNNFDDDITENEGHDRTEAVMRELESRLAEVGKALERVEEGAYGKCANCGKNIPEERLKIYPTASLCLDCERR
ncbi:MAG: TraR/DksA C4-type zinc finger protein [Patescibacteria group bacterium]|nr:TraR/DksA C4-type zinc finger protein [Patescibacteria group bacterium]MCL5411704.1 TraR/DksA C4-type zinc finger protein [Patescibacteria group bacterium]